uniref:Uncharacterized protein n=1 Tax=Siphoviridae sp. ctHxr66 TaxID=2826237 RepID=A0A8S5MHF5_9CAUD|nr:MAG TPA: hypothetical protein [Siphoviridae sp. ctHxr66]DAH31824.1 MAG TPA: hypothetical protein [Caudoviricetes sp.]
MAPGRAIGAKQCADHACCLALLFYQHRPTGR